MVKVRQEGIGCLGDLLRQS